MARVGWIDPEADGLFAEWRDAPSDDAVLARYLGAAHEQCLEFLPHHRDAAGAWVPRVPDPVPDRLKLAQLLQARALYNAVVTGSGDQQGEGALAVTVFPMDWTVKNLLRPKTIGGVL